jgi:hypothetical protein
VAAFAVIVGSIVGGLGWLETRSPKLQSAPPIVIQVPAPAAPAPAR